MKKFNQKILIKDIDLPKGTLEKVVITRNGERWFADIDILEPFDKANSIIEESDGTMPVDTKWKEINTSPEQKKILKFSALDFEILRHKSMEISIFNRTLGQVSDVLMEEMIHNSDFSRFSVMHPNIRVNAVVAGISRYNRYCHILKKRNSLRQNYDKINMADVIREFKKPPMDVHEIVMSSGFFIKNGILRIPQYGIHVPSPRFKGKYLQYLTLTMDKGTGEWGIRYKYRRKNIIRVIRDFFNFKDNPVKAEVPYQSLSNICINASKDKK